MIFPFIFYKSYSGLFSIAFSDTWKATVTERLDALVTSCVVVPCSFSHPGKPLPSSKLRGIWHISTKREDVVFNEDHTRILDEYKGRTRMLGLLGQNNCTLEINDVKDHDNGPFCFRIELVKSEGEKFSFVEDCVDLTMQRMKTTLLLIFLQHFIRLTNLFFFCLFLTLIDSPPEIQLYPSTTALEGKAYTATCKVRHTCPSFMPKLSWSRGKADQILERHEQLSPGNWMMESVLTFILEEKDDHSELNCTAVFHGGKTTTKTLPLYIKRKTCSVYSFSFLSKLYYNCQYMSTFAEPVSLTLKLYL